MLCYLIHHHRDQSVYLNFKGNAAWNCDKCKIAAHANVMSRRPILLTSYLHVVLFLSPSENWSKKSPTSLSERLANLHSTIGDKVVRSTWARIALLLAGERIVGLKFLASYKKHMPWLKCFRLFQLFYIIGIRKGFATRICWAQVIILKFKIKRWMNEAFQLTSLKQNLHSLIVKPTI